MISQKPIWKSVAIKELLEIQIGGLWGAPKGESEVDVNVVRVTELQPNGGFDPATAVVRSISKSQLSSRKLKEGDLVLEKSGGGPNQPVGRVGLVSSIDHETICSNFMLLMRPNRMLVNPRYLWLFLTYLHLTGQTIPLQSSSTNIRNINTTDYLNSHVPLPSLEEQKYIAKTLENHLSRLDKAIADIRQCRELLSVERRAILHSAFMGELHEHPGAKGVIEHPQNWESKQISEVAEIVRGVTYSKSKVLSEPDQAGIALLRATNIQPGRLDYDDPVWIPRSLVKETQVLRQGDLLVATSSGSLFVVGKNARVIEDRTATFGAFCTVIRPKNIDSRYLALWLESPYVRNLWSDKARGSNINNLKSSDLASTGVAVPPLEVQKCIVETLEDHLSRLEKTSQTLDFVEGEANQLRRSLLHAAFTGQLTNEDSND